MDEDAHPAADAPADGEVTAVRRDGHLAEGGRRGEGAKGQRRRAEDERGAAQQEGKQQDAVTEAHLTP
jgi:hypothetical protein